MDAEPKLIDYGILAQALEFYQARGYNYREVPWVVSPEATNVTLPVDRIATSVSYGDLVGSAEQSFIELMIRGDKLTKHCAITPCFRDEERYDALHHAYFMKCELYDADATDANLHSMIDIAVAFHGRYLPVEVTETGPDAYDIVSVNSGHELGSYGFRQYKGQRFIYGTGCALPRLTTVITGVGASVAPMFA